MDHMRRDWGLSKWATYRLGLLEEEEQLEMEQLLSADPEFLQMVGPPNGFDDPTEDGKHIPEPLVANWPGTVRSIRGFQRAMLRQHLNRCETCQEDLRILGFDAALPEIPELEQDPSEAGQHSPARGSVRRAPRTSSPQRRSRSLAWVTGISLATAAAAIALLVLSPRSQSALPELLVMPGARGGEEPVAAARLRASDDGVLIRFEGIDALPAGTPFVVHILRMENAEFTLETELVFESRTFLALGGRITVTLKAGRYRAELLTREAVGSERRWMEREFTIEP